MGCLYGMSSEQRIQGYYFPFYGVGTSAWKVQLQLANLIIKGFYRIMGTSSYILESTVQIDKGIFLMKDTKI